MERSLREKFFKALVAAQQHRGEKSRWVSDTELEWMVFEREVMFNFVNDERAALGKKPVTMDEIKRVEACASGHVDYTRKFSLYCSELVNK